MKKRWIAAFLACTVISGLFTGCGAKEDGGVSKEEAQKNQPVNEQGTPDAYGKYEDPVTVEIVQAVNPTFQMPEGDTTTDNYFTRYLKEHANIDIKLKWQAATADFSQKMSLAIASNDLPDVMVVGKDDFKKLVKADLIEDLTPYYEKYASDLIKDSYEKTEGRAIESASVDGKIYGLPSVQAEADGYNLMWIRQDWLEELNLEAPDTVEELETVAQVFVDHQLGGENTVGILGPSSGSAVNNNFLSSSAGIATLDGFFQSYQSFPGFWVEGEDGETVYGSTTPETKEALGKLQQMYKDGILDQELGARKDADETWKSGKAGIFFGPWWVGYSVKDALANDPEAEWRAYAAPLGEDGKWYSKMGNNVGDTFCVVRKGYEHPEAAVILNNFLRRDEGKFMQETTLDMSFYPGRVIIAPVDECSYEFQQLDKKRKGEAPDEYDPANYKMMDTDLASLDTCLKKPDGDLSIEDWNVDDTNFGRMYSLLMGTSAQVEAEQSGKLVKVYSETYGQTETMEQKWANLKKKEDELFLKIIIGDADLDAFDTFVDEWYAEGGEEITKEVQKEAGK